MGEKKKICVCAYKEQYPGAAKYCQLFLYFCLLWDKSTSWHCVSDIMEGAYLIYCHPHFNANVGGGQSVAL
jgi:hypothetical protein